MAVAAVVAELTYRLLLFLEVHKAFVTFLCYSGSMSKTGFAPEVSRWRKVALEELRHSTRLRQ